MDGEDEANTSSPDSRGVVVNVSFLNCYDITTPTTATTYTERFDVNDTGDAVATERGSGGFGISDVEE